jgi:bifunctional non-homologous end joining protein LigD
LQVAGMADRLERYREMRDFEVTPEPRGKKVVRRKRGLRYYIQRHDATRLHYDLRLELEGVLTTQPGPAWTSRSSAPRA